MLNPAQTEVKVSDNFLVESINTTQTVVSGLFDYEITVAKQGYKTLGVIGSLFPRDEKILINQVYVHLVDGKLKIAGKNLYGTSVSNNSSVYILYVKE